MSNNNVTTVTLGRREEKEATRKKMREVPLSVGRGPTVPISHFHKISKFCTQKKVESGPTWTQQRVAVINEAISNWNTPTHHLALTRPSWWLPQSRDWSMSECDESLHIYVLSLDICFIGDVHCLSTTSMKWTELWIEMSTNNKTCILSFALSE